MQEQADLYYKVPHFNILVTRETDTKSRESRVLWPTFLVWDVSRKYTECCHILEGFTCHLADKESRDAHPSTKLPYPPEILKFSRVSITTCWNLKFRYKTKSLTNKILQPLWNFLMFFIIIIIAVNFHGKSREKTIWLTNKRNRTFVVHGTLNNEKGKLSIVQWLSEISLHVRKCIDVYVDTRSLKWLPGDLAWSQMLLIKTKIVERGLVISESCNGGLFENARIPKRQVTKNHLL